MNTSAWLGRSVAKLIPGQKKQPKCDYSSADRPLAAIKKEVIAASSEALAAEIQKDITGIRAFEQRGPRFLQITLDAFTGNLANGRYAFLAAFAKADQVSRVEMEIVQFKAGQLGDAKAGGVEQLQHGAVAVAQGRGRVRGVEQARDLLAGEHVGQKSRQLGVFNERRR